VRKRSGSGASGPWGVFRRRRPAHLVELFLEREPRERLDHVTFAPPAPLRRLLAAWLRPSHDTGNLASLGVGRAPPFSKSMPAFLACSSSVIRTRKRPLEHDHAVLHRRFGNVVVAELCGGSSRPAHGREIVDYEKLQLCCSLMYSFTHHTSSNAIPPAGQASLQPHQRLAMYLADARFAHSQPTRQFPSVHSAS